MRHDIHGSSLKLSKSFNSVRSGAHPVIPFLQERLGHFLIHSIVFDQKDAQERLVLRSLLCDQRAYVVIVDFRLSQHPQNHFLQFVLPDRLGQISGDP